MQFLPHFSVETDFLHALAVPFSSHFSIPTPSHKVLSLRLRTVSSAATLSDKTQFLSFFRMIASNQAYYPHLTERLTHFGWTWPGLASQDEGRGQEGRHRALAGLSEVRVCPELSVERPTCSRGAGAASAEVVLVLTSSGVFCGCRRASRPR